MTFVATKHTRARWATREAGDAPQKSKINVKACVSFTGTNADDYPKCNQHQGLVFLNETFIDNFTRDIRVVSRSCKTSGLGTGDQGSVQDTGCTRGWGAGVECNLVGFNSSSRALINAQHRRWKLCRGRGCRGEARREKAWGKGKGECSSGGGRRRRACVGARRQPIQAPLWSSGAQGVRLHALGRGVTGTIGREGRKIGALRAFLYILDSVKLQPRYGALCGLLQIFQWQLPIPPG